MDQAEQDRLTRQVGRALLTIAPPSWSRIRAEYRSVGRHVEVDVYVTGPDGQTYPGRPPAELVDGLGALHQGMYVPGRGTWLSAVYELEPPSSFSAEFEPDIEPLWRRLPPPIGFQDELRFFPRADEHIPEWLRARAGLPPVPPQQPGPPMPPGPQGPPAPPTPPYGAAPPGPPPQQYQQPQAPQQYQPPPGSPMGPPPGAFPSPPPMPQPVPQWGPPQPPPPSGPGH